MSLKTAVKRMERQLRLDDDDEVVIYDLPNDDGTVDVLHISSKGSRKETITQQEYDRRRGIANESKDSS
ncbi:hypothetical protein [Syntrophomonas wolfei]|jgi:hypothetical protein|uniref:hypothetical protein n=1 Tax=Syntrophomonas wolfei TaxID=863 RepID=UPI0023F0D2BF|nr:hypothetical protein [Syntrophomonas wolfei]